MNNFRTVFSILIIISTLIISCSSKSSNGSDDSSQASSFSNEDVNYDESSECGYEDGSHNATVVYNNPETNYSSTYTLTVDVQDCNVVQINFPNDGYLDEDHISSANIDEEGDATVSGENGKTYEVHIDN